MNVVYGGTFNPITKAHETIVNTILNTFEVENFIFLPVGNFYTRKEITDDVHRVNMIKLSFQNNSKVVISDIELKANEYKGTYCSLKELSKEYNDIYFVIGGDNLLDLKTWLNLDLLLNEFKFIVINRDRIDLNQVIEENYSKYKDHFVLINIDMNISSSMVREDIENNKDKINEEVYSYIKNNKLYGVK